MKIVIKNCQNTPSLLALFGILATKIKDGGKNMSKVQWTKEQMQAIEEKDSNILVAAAARKWKNSCAC